VQKLILIVFGLAALAGTLGLTGVVAQARLVAEGLFGLGLIMTLLVIVDESDQSPRG
jgi:uncharacterized membrane protein YtjA (UPF0391 family)